MLLVLQWFMYPPVPGPPPRPTGREVLTEGTHHVRRVVDGDTLLMAIRRTEFAWKASTLPKQSAKIGPSSPGAPKRSAFTKDSSTGAKYNVKLSFGNERLDDYGRYLAFVWDGDKMLNEELVRAGLAEARLGWHFSYSLKRRLRLAEDEAERANRGIWSGTSPEPA